MATHQQVAHAFIRGEKAKGSKTEGGVHRMFTEGNVIYSYGYHYPLAKRVLCNVVILNVCPSSVSTAKHRNHVRKAIPSSWVVLECDGLEAEWALDSAEFKAAFIAYHEAGYDAARAKQDKARSERMVDVWGCVAVKHTEQLALLDTLLQATL